ncbi:hypothetical protein HanOQP8_Chr02g0045331 [Helianthus annuus]|nr:hypothetical protein HanOQP8_Chr02g0045331 [Helianthus annuus]
MLAHSCYDERDRGERKLQKEKAKDAAAADGSGVVLRPFFDDDEDDVLSLSSLMTPATHSGR